MAANWDHKLKNDKVSGKVKAKFCQPCFQLEKTKTAVIFCSTCEEYQCMDCLKVHHNYAYMKSHKLVNANEAKRKLVSFDMKGLDQCNQHQKVIEFFCEDDGQLCCSTCAIADHRSCKHVVDVKKVTRLSAPKSSSLKVNLQEVKQKVEIIVSGVVNAKKTLDEDVKEIPIRIRRMRDEVMKMFDELEESVVKDAESLRTETSEKLTKKQLQNEKYLADIQSCLDTIDNVNQNGTPVQQFIAEEKMKEKVDGFYTKVDAECKGLETVRVSFEFDGTLKLPPLPITDYVTGHLNVKTYLSEVVSKVQFTPYITVDLKQSKDDEEEPFYTGIDFLPDGRLVAVDNKNKKCLVYNENLDKVGSFQLSYPPQSVVAVSEQEVAITNCRNRLEILQVNKSNQITLDRSYKVTTPYTSICKKDDGHFVVSTIDHTTPVRILSSTGEEKDFNINFPNKKYPISTSACTYIRNSDKIVLTDRYEHTVYIYDVKTNTRVAVKDDQMKEPFAATIGPNDTILVCSRTTHSIFQISQSGRIISSFKADMQFPCTICVPRDQSFLIVSNACTGARKLQKWKITY